MSEIVPPDSATSQRVQYLIASRLNVPPPPLDLDLMDGSVLDSLAVVELLVELERAFGIQLDLMTLDIDDLRTAASIAAMVDRNRPPRSGSA